MPNCLENETLEHFLLDCPRSKQVWKKKAEAGFKIQINAMSVYFGIFDPSLSQDEYNYYYTILLLLLLLYALSR